jgi:hypothetical protein
MVDKPLIEKPLRISNVRPDLLYENPHARAFPEQPLSEEQDVSLGVF